MHNIQLRFFILIIAIPSLHANINVSPYIRTRSQASSARTRQCNPIWWAHCRTCDAAHTSICTPQASLSISAVYSKSNKAGRMAENLFGGAIQGSKWDSASIRITGSGVEGRNKQCEWLADYFGLPRDYESELHIKPRIDNFIADIDINYRCIHSAPQLWTRLHIPVGYTRWDLNACERFLNTGKTNHQPGYFNNEIVFGQETGPNEYENAYGVARDNLVCTAVDFFSAQKTPDLGDTVHFHCLTHAQLIRRKEPARRKGGGADIHWDIGYDILSHDHYKCAIGPLFVFPTGNRPEGIYAFEPIIGNGHHWECGAHVAGLYSFFNDEANDETFLFYGDARISHMFATRQKRTFDLKQKPNSRYMLAQKMNSSTSSLFTNEMTGAVDNSTRSPLQFDNVLLPVANISTIEVDVSIGWQADAVLMLEYAKKNMTWQIGYNIWGRSCESIKQCSDGTDIIDCHTWALKGDAHIYGFTNDIAIPDVNAIPLGATQSDATIFNGTNNFTSTNTHFGGINGIKPTRNPGIDNPAYARTTQNAAGQNILNRPDATGAQTFSGAPPTAITRKDLDIVGAQTKGLSHSFFAGFWYTWDNIYDGYMFYCGAGAQAEFHAVDRFCTIVDKHTCTLSCRSQTKSSCRFCGVSQWAVWLKSGINFN